MRLLSALFLLAAVQWASAAIPGRFLSYPSIRGDQVVFTYEGDLWRTTAKGGEAVRLTTHPGSEFAAQISPDGQWVAFAGSYDSGCNVYLMPIQGGAPQRLTWQHPVSSVLGWTPDGRIIFRAALENTYRGITKLYTVSVKGEMPEELPVPTGVLCSFTPDGKRMAYCPRGNEEYYWKRYKGGQHQEIWSYDFAGKKFQKLTDYVGKNSYPMWVGNRIYFVSDRGEDGIANLYRMDPGSKITQVVTRFKDFDVQMAQSDGKRVVFTQAGYLYVLDANAEAPRRVPVQLPSDQWRLADRTVNAKGYIQHMGVANDGKSAVFEARGDVFLVPEDENAPTVNLTRTPDTRERFPQLSPDGKRVAFFSDKSGEYELYTANVDAAEPWVRLTTGLNKTVYHLEWSPDGSKILFSDKEFTLYYVEVGSKKLVKIDSSTMLKNDEFTWEVSDYTWSPDSQWVAYSFVQSNRNSQVFLYNVDRVKSYPLTTDFYDNLYPTFDANGEWLYYCSYRNFDVQMDAFEDNHIIPNPVQVMVVQLKAGQRPPFEKIPKDTTKAETKKDVPFRIDLDGIENRIYPLPVKAGNYFYAKAGKGKITWAAIDSFHEDEYEEMYRPRGACKWALHFYDIAERKETVLDGKVSDWKVSPSGEQMIIQRDGDYFVTTVDKAADSKSAGSRLEFDQMVYHVQPRTEWQQIFNDTWRWYRDFFYDADMHGRDWKKMGEKYRAMIPDLPSRNALNTMLSQMVGELCVSHTYVGGGDTQPSYMPSNPVYTGFLGVDLAADPSGYYRLVRIYGPTDFNREIEGPLVRPDLKVKPGDYLISIDGHEIKAPENPYRYLQVIAGQKVRVGVNDQPQAKGAKFAEIEPIRSEHSLRYNRWVADNIQKTLEATGGDVGYLHLTAMDSGNVARFDKFWRAFRYKKGIIIDVRGNGGGWTEYFIIDKLERKQTAYNVIQGMTPYRYPNSASQARYTLISNEANGSDGEAFVEHFKARQLGTVVGVPSWGGLVGIINRQKTIDNGYVEQSNNAFWGAKGKWLVENHGADPDIVTPQDPAAVLAGRDPQLEKAIEVVLKDIRDNPWKFPARPAYPKK